MDVKLIDSIVETLDEGLENAYAIFDTLKNVCHTKPIEDVTSCYGFAKTLFYGGADLNPVVDRGVYRVDVESGRHVCDVKRETIPPNCVEICLDAYGLNFREILYLKKLIDLPGNKKVGI